MNKQYTGYYIFGNMKNKTSCGGIRADIEDEKAKILWSFIDKYKYEESDLETAEEFEFSLSDLKDIQSQLARFISDLESKYSVLE